MAHGLIAISETNEKGLNNLVRHYDYDNHAIFNLSIFQNFSFKIFFLFFSFLSFLFFLSATLKNPPLLVAAIAYTSVFLA